MLDRRHFLKNSAVLSLTPAIPAFLAKTALATPQNDDGRVLIVIQLDGGNDGINTVVPFKDEGYAKYRKELRLPESDLIKLTDDLAFHPRLRSASELFQDGRLSIVQAVGYPNPNRSHFESMGIWHTASLEKEARKQGSGWLGQAMSLENAEARPHTIHVGDEELPLAVRGRRCNAASISNPADLELTLSDLTAGDTDHADRRELLDFVTRSTSDAYTSARQLAASTQDDSSARYPDSMLSQRLRLSARMIKAGAAARVYYIAQSGYDTHAVQLPTHGDLLGELSSSLKAFMNDMKQSGLDDRILVMAFSEFGRRVKENASIGTDHGTAGPVLLAGTKLSNRLYGQSPSLLDLDDGDLKYSTDFRDIYAAILTDWLNIKRPDVLAGFGAQGIFRV